MPRFVPIRLTQNDRQEYQRLVRNAKAKVNRIQNNFGLDLSDKINPPKITKIKTRQEYNQIKAELESFTNRANTHYQFVKNSKGVVASKHELFIAEQKNKRNQRKAKKMIEKYREKPTIIQGEEQGTVGTRMQMMKRPTLGGITVPPDFNFENFNDRKGFERRFNNILKRDDDEYYDIRNKTMMDNFIKILDLSFNSEADELIKQLKSLNPDDFFDIYLQNPLEFDFNMYDSEGQYVDANQQTINAMLSTIHDYKSGKVNKDLKGF